MVKVFVLFAAILSCSTIAAAFHPAAHAPLLTARKSTASCLQLPSGRFAQRRTPTLNLLTVSASTTGSQLSAPPTPGQLNAPELIKWLWNEAQFREDYPACSMEFFADDVVYEDMVYAEPFVGKAAVRDMLIKTKELAPPDFVFVLDRVGDGAKCCGFTWHIELSTRPDAGKFANGMSMYELNDEGRICYVRDLVEPFPKTGDFGLRLASVLGKILKLSPPPEPSST
mmetsp:Transcript_46198/g.92340  ORF Transcript_46198/g.92340 Transcript_46198/m.92340 type:complete len:227 (-) Transcript_46198:473-1153(-)